MDRILNMIFNRILRRLINRGVGAALRDRDGQGASAQRNAQHMRQTTRIARRLTRF